MHFSKIFLIIGLIFAGIGFCDVMSEGMNGLFRGVGAICFCIFLISYLLKDMMAEYDRIGHGPDQP